VVTGGIFAVLLGVGWKGLGVERFFKDVNVRKASSEDHNIKKANWKVALEGAGGFFYTLLTYILSCVFLGAFIYDFIPQEFIVKYAGGDKPWTIPIASIVGIPMYIRAEAILPIGDALVSKGMGIGSVIALLIGGAGASIPEVVLLSK